MPKYNGNKIISVLDVLKMYGLTKEDYKRLPNAFIIQILKDYYTNPNMVR